MTDKKQDQELEEYLQGKSRVSRQYRSEATQQPAKHLDDAILAAARKEAASRPHGIYKLYRSDWYKPVSWAAVLVICVGLVFNIYQDSDQELLTAPTPDITLDKPAAVGANEAIEMKKDAAGKTWTESILDKDKKNTEVDAAKPEDIKMIWQQERIQMEDTGDIKPRDAAPVMKEQIMQDKVLRRETIDIQTEQQVESVTGDDASVSITEEIEPERSKIRSRQADIDISEMTTITSEPGTEMMTPEQWLEHISQLWNQGNREQAIDSLKQFLKVYPEYPVENVREKLPEELNLSDYLN